MVAGPWAIHWIRGREPSTEAGREVLQQTCWLFGSVWIALFLLGVAAERLFTRPRAASTLAGPAPRLAPPVRTLPSSTPARLRWLLWMPATICLAVGLAAAPRPLNYDEILEVKLDVERPFPEALQPHGVFANHVLAVVPAKLGARIDAGEAGLRLPFVLAAAGAVGILAMSAAGSTGSLAVGVLAGLLLLVHSEFVVHIASIRGYALCSLGAVALGHALHRPRTSAREGHGRSGRGHLRWVVAAATVMGTSHLFGWVLLSILATVASLAVGMNAFRDHGANSELPIDVSAHRDQALALLAAAAVAWVAWAPALPWFFFGIEGSGRREAWSSLLRTLEGVAGTPGAAAVAVLVFAGTCVGLLRAWRRFPGQRVTIAALMIFFATTALAAILLRPRFLAPRFFVPAIALTILVAAVGIGTERRGIGLLGVLLALLAPFGYRGIRDYPDLRSAISGVTAARLRTTPLYLPDNPEDRLVLSYYLNAPFVAADPTSSARRSDPAAWLVHAGSSAESELMNSADWSGRCAELLMVGGQQSDVRLWWPPESAECSTRGDASKKLPPIGALGGR